MLDPQKPEALEGLETAAECPPAMRLASLGSCQRNCDGMIERRTTAILCVDIVDFTGLMERDEDNTARRLCQVYDLIEQAATARRGRVFNRAGDANLVEFADVADAVAAAKGLQASLPIVNLEMAPADHMTLRIGIHHASVIQSGSDLIGTGVNIATRLQEAASPGHTVLSEAAVDALPASIDLCLKDLGSRELRHLQQPVRLYEFC